MKLFLSLKVIKFFVTKTVIALCLSKSMVEILAKIAIYFAINYFGKCYVIAGCFQNSYSLLNPMNGNIYLSCQSGDICC